MARPSHRLDHDPFLVRPDRRFRLADVDPGDTQGFEDKQAAQEALLEDVSALAEAQELLWASARQGVLIVFQAMDAAGKDGTIKHVMSGVNPTGVDVFSFKAPTDEEVLHHFLWRPMRFLPARGRIAIFNRSYYEEVLVVRVHPEFLDRQALPGGFDRRDPKDLRRLWERRYGEINAFEKLLADNGTCIIKFFLHVSRDEQRRRFLERLDDPAKHWKFSPADVAERAHWDEYMQAFEDMLAATSTGSAPWHVIPADRKWFLRAAVADVIAARIESLDLKWPEVPEGTRSALQAAREALAREGRDAG